MKVSVCANCHITPNITATEIKCPKCGKTAKGEKLAETVTNWNEGKFSTTTKVKMTVEEEPVEEKAEEPMKEPEIKEEKPVRRPVRRRRSE